MRLAVLAVLLVGCHREPTVEGLDTEDVYDGSRTVTVTLACHGADRDHCEAEATSTVARACPWPSPRHPFASQLKGDTVVVRWRCDPRRP